MIVKDLQSAHKPQWRMVCDSILAGKVYRNSSGPHAGPGAVYAAYKDYCTFMEAEAVKG